MFYFHFMTKIVLGIFSSIWPAMFFVSVFLLMFSKLVVLVNTLHFSLILSETYPLPIFALGFRFILDIVSLFILFGFFNNLMCFSAAVYTCLHFHWLGCSWILFVLKSKFLLLHCFPWLTECRIDSGFCDVFFSYRKESMDKICHTFPISSICF